VFEQPEDGFLFQPCRYDGTLEAAPDPFTREPIHLPRNGTLTDGEVQAVKAFLQTVASKRHGNVLIVSDGLEALVHDEDLPKNLVVDPRGNMSKALASFLHALLVAGRWCIRGEEEIVVSSRKSVMGLPPVDDPRLPPDLPAFPTRILVCATLAELIELLGA
jgi:hypothetical protein